MDDTARTASLAFGTGVLAHLGIFIRGEWHMRGPYVLMVHFLLVLGGYYWLQQKHVVPAPAQTVAMIAGSYLTGLFTSMTIYRLFFHRLRKFPGPVMARVSKLWHVWECLGSRNYALLDRMYEKYGSVVRIGPNEVAIFHPDAIQLIEGTSKCWRPDYDDLIFPDSSVAFERDPKLHAERRQVWNRATNKKVLPSYYPRLQRQVEVLEHKLGEKSGLPIFVNDLIAFWSFDSMGEFAFNQDFGMMHNEQWHDAIDMIRKATSILGPMKSVIWLIRLGLFFVPRFWRIGDWNKAMAFCRQRLQDRIGKKGDEPDIAQFFIEQAEKDGYTEQAWKWLRGDGPAVVVGGSDTTTPTVTMLFYALAKYPHHQDLILAELAALDNTYDIPALEKLPHLNACITETLRLWPAAATTVIRMTPPEGLNVGGVQIPGGVHVTAPRWTNFRDELAFPRGKEFVPERWTTKPEMVARPKGFFPFGAGRSMCPGQGIAWAQIRMVLASTVKNYRICPVEGEPLERAQTDMKDQLTLKPGKLVLRFEKRKA